MCGSSFRKCPLFSITAHCLSTFYGKTWLATSIYPKHFLDLTLISRQYILILNLALLQYNQAPANVMDAGLNTGTRDESGFWQARNLPRMMFYFYSLLLFIYWLLGIWDLSSLTRDQEFPCIGSIVLTTGSPGESQGWHFPESYFAFPTRQ